MNTTQKRIAARKKAEAKRRRNDLQWAIGGFLLIYVFFMILHYHLN